MPRNKFLFALLTLSLSCFAQNAGSTGVSTTSPPVVIQSASPYAPTVVPSDVTLPGSGPPVGAPITDSNDARTGGDVQVYNPATVVEHPVVNAGAAANLSSSSLQMPVNIGLQSFEGSAPLSQGQEAVSLGEIARQYRSQPHQVALVLTNDSVAQLNGGNQNTVAAAPQRNIQQEMAMAAALPPVTSENNAPALPQNDAGASMTQNSTAQPSGQINQQRRSTSNSAHSQTQANTAAAPAQSEEGEQNNQSSKLPQSGSALPLLSLMGLLIVGAGTVYLLRR